MSDLNGFITTQAAYFMICYTILATLIFLPTVKYDTIVFKDRVYYAMYCLFGGAFAAYSVNCMILGQCSSWSWILVGLGAIVPLLLGLLYIFFYDTMVELEQKLYNAFYEALTPKTTSTDDTGGLTKATTTPLATTTAAKM